MNGARTSWTRAGMRGVVAAGLALTMVVAGIGVAAADSSTTSTTSITATTASPAKATSSGGVTRTPLGQASPGNAPGQTLYLQKVTIAPHAKLAEHFHQGTQIARVVSGTLTYNIVSGTARVVSAKGASQDVTGPKKIKLRSGETVIETAGLVHFGANDTGSPVVIELTALLAQGAPLATTTGSTPGTAPIVVTTNLTSQSRTLLNAGADNSVVYGWNRLTGTATVGGQPVTVEFLASVAYTKGSGPFSGFVTFSFADGSTLGMSIQGQTLASADTTNATFAGALGVVGGTSRYVAATGSGTFVGSRTAALGSVVAATFTLAITGVR